MNVKRCFIDSSEMPNSCRGCRFRHKFIQGKWYWYCLLSADVDINNDNRPSDCPLVAIDAIVPDINDGDTINRQAAIDALINHEPTSTLAITNVIDKDVARAIIEELPSAQPEIIYCRECKHRHYDSKDIPYYCDRIDYGYGWDGKKMIFVVKERDNDCAESY